MNIQEAGTNNVCEALIPTNITLLLMNLVDQSLTLFSLKPYLSPHQNQMNKPHTGRGSQEVLLGRSGNFMEGPPKFHIVTKKSLET